MRNLLCLFLVVMLFPACEKQGNGDITFGAPGKTYGIVVEGGINTFYKIQYIRLSEPSFSADGTVVPAVGARVTVTDGGANVVFRETATPGVYSGTIQNNTNYNKAYKLNITYKDKSYTATDTLRQVVNIIDDFLPLGCIKQANGTIKLTIPKHTFGFLNSCKWLISYPEIPAWNPARFENAGYFNYTHIQGSPNSVYPLINQLRIVELQPNDFVSIYKFSMSDAYSQYLYTVFQETDWKGLFSGVPAEVKGNLSAGALGFFYVTDVDIRRYRASELAN
ncbi:DUF4249 family protein [Hufsiella ginkgonis]|uniref:DUF4249 family protein n=1 Tax=Hufsiella ginkgonis TaxID=2695274 RepID=A0A7K1XW19_9SPHI|nr:DUF4249 family protein [Hufsiella ginkgonis]MXV15172.1 hypothetical protein [Hufsiella ginkgonis]